MKNKKLISALWVAFYLLGVICSYNSSKKVFIKVNTEFDYGQPRFSKENQIVSFTVSITSWIGFASAEIFNALAYSNLDKEPAYEF